MEENLFNALRRAKTGARAIDLSYPFEEGMPVWPTHARYGAITYETYDVEGVSMHREVCFGEHCGTHIDAPRHFIKGGQAIDEIDPARVMGRAATLDATFLPPRGAFTLAHLKAFEAKNGPIEAGDVVFLHFGWGEKYGLGKNSLGFLKDWPGLAGEAAAYLRERDVAAVGTDALALDPFGSPDFPCHVDLLGHGIPILENVRNLGELPPFSFAIGLFTKFKGGSASPINIIALV